MMKPIKVLTYICVSLCSIIWLPGIVEGGEQVPEQRAGDPPRISAHDLYEYRHMQLFNPDYIKWVEENIREIDYVRKAGAMSLKWDAMTDVDLQESPVVVMVTQTTVSRLGALREVMKEWDGPVAVAVYIEYKADTEQAGSCESKVTQYMKEAVAELWPSVDAAPPVSVSFLYTAFDIPDAACVVKQSGKSPEDSQSHDDAGHAAGESSPHTSYHAGSREYGSPSIPQRLYNRMQRNLLEAWQQGGSSQSPPDSMPQVGHNPTPVKSVWHFKRGGTKVMVSSRPWKQVYDEFYPVNALRNLAWEQVPSGVFVFLNDIDFVPTPTLHSELTEGKWRSELQRMRSVFFESQIRETLVLPAFERLGAQGRATPWTGACEESSGCKMIQGMALPRTFDMLRTMLQNEKTVDVFHRPQFVMGHGCYSWLSWLQDENPKEMVHMEYAHPCEPYVIALSDALPRYDDRFRGRGQNKVEQLTHMAMWGFNWRLLPGHFVLHVPHPSTVKPDGGWDIATTPLALMKSKMVDIENEPQFRRHVVQAMPAAVKDD